MRRARARVFNGHIATRATSPKTTKLFPVVDEPRRPITLDATDAAAIRTARASIRAGRTVSMEELVASLGRL